MVHADSPQWARPQHSRGGLAWCAAQGVDPLDTNVEQIHRAAPDLDTHGGSELEVLDLIDQVGFTSGLWRTPEWVHLRRTF